MKNSPVLLILVLGMCCTHTAGSAVNVSLSVENQQLTGTSFSFDIVLTGAGTDLLYLASADFVLTFNSGNFSDPALTKGASSTFQLTATSNQPTGTNYRNQTSTASIAGNELIINLNLVGFGEDQPGFDNIVARIDNTPSTHRMGRYTVSGITNLSGTIGLHWKTGGTGLVTRVFGYAPTWDWATSEVAVEPSDPPDAPLPITLASFSVRPCPKGPGMLLAWETLSEINNYGFFVQRRDTEDLPFTRLANSFVPGRGTTNVPAKYTYIDSSNTITSSYYRLEQVDLDGSVHFSTAVQIAGATGVREQTLPREYAFDPTFPNPFNPTTTLRYALPSGGIVSVVIFDMLGREVAVLANGYRDAGFYHTVWNSLSEEGSSVTSGVYFARVMVTDNAGNTKFTKVNKLLLLK